MILGGGSIDLVALALELDLQRAHVLLRHALPTIVRAASANEEGFASVHGVVAPVNGVVAPVNGVFAP
eukprot:3224942-Rhodomonas_salina.1